MVDVGSIRFGPARGSPRVTFVPGAPVEHRCATSWPLVPLLARVHHCVAPLAPVDPLAACVRPPQPRSVVFAFYNLVWLYTLSLVANTLCPFPSHFS